MPFVFVYNASDFVGGLPDETGFFAGGTAAGTPPFTLQLLPGATPTLIEITDADTNFDEGDNPPQVLTSGATIDGTAYPAGTTINTAYDLLNTGSGHQVSSFHMAGDGFFQTGPVDGLVSSIELVPGVSYTFDTARSSLGQTNPYTGFFSCFTAGTKIDAEHGSVDVEKLRVGECVRTADHGLQPIRLVLKRTLTQAELAQSPNLEPVLIKTGALGEGLPKQDLCVSPQHRMLVRSKVAARMFGTADALVSARRLSALPGIDVAPCSGSVTYVHLILDRHEILFANGAPTESLYLGPMALSAMEPEALEEIATLFPGLLNGTEPVSSARLIPTGAKQKRLVHRHAKNRKPVLSGSDFFPRNSQDRS